MKSLGREVKFLHRDELAKEFGITDIQLPAAFVHCIDEEPELWLEADKIDACKSLGELEQLVTDNLNLKKTMELPSSSKI